jgi:hypothetical protein
MALAMLTRPTWDLEGCRQFLSTNSILEPSRTLFAGVEKLAPSSIFQLAAGRIAGRQKYWSLANVLYGGPSDLRGDVPKLAAELRKALLIVHKNFARPLMDLTGGFDTRGILGATLSLGLRFDAVVNGRDDQPDVVAAVRIARECGVTLHRRFHGFSSIQRWWNCAKASLDLCDGECDVLYYAPAFQIHSLMANEFDAAIVGIDGEIVQGKWWQLTFPFSGWRRLVNPQLIVNRRLAPEGEIRGLLAHRFPEDLRIRMASVVREVNTGLERYPNTSQIDNVYLRLHQHRHYGRISSATQHIWPCISPYGFRGPLEMAVSAPASVRIRRRMSRRLIEYLNPELAELPTEEGYPALPLRPWNAHRFGQLARRYSPLIWRRLLLELGLPSPAPRKNNPFVEGGGHLIARLCELEEVRELLDPTQMATRELYDPMILGQVLEEGRTERDVGTYQVGRILTLELLARAIRNVKPASEAHESAPPENNKQADRLSTSGQRLQD